MSWLSLLRRLAASVSGRRDDDRVREELQEHLALLTDDYERAGLPPAEARRRARLRLGTVDAITEACGDERRLRGLEDFWRDVRYALRTFWKRPAFALTAVLTLGVGIGATTALFGVVYGVLLKPLPFHEADRLMVLRHHAPHGAGANHGPATYLTYLENQRAFEAIGAWDAKEVSITGRSDPERAQALLVTSSTLPLLRVQPALGRFFRSEDDTPGTPLRTILTHGYWQSRFGGASDVVGSSLLVDGQAAEVIGVLPASFTFLRSRAQMLLPLPLDVNAPRDISFDFQALGRLAPGITPAQANSDVARMIALLPPVFAELELRPDVRPLAEDMVGGVREILWLLLAAVGVVLMIACANVANLFLVRAEGRHHELLVRTALGASRARIRRGLLTESVVLALAGGIVGVVLAYGATTVLRTLAPAELPRIEDIGINVQVVLFTVAVSLLSGVLFSLFAVFRFSNPRLATLKEGGRSVSDGPTRHQARDLLVVGQIALALTLLIVSGLMMRTFLALREVDPGFTDPAHVQTFVISIPPGLIQEPLQAARTFERVADQIARVPGVTSVGISSSITMDGEDNGNPIVVEGSTARGPNFRFKALAPGYVETMGNRFVAGRSITWAEIYERRPVIVVSEALAREYWSSAAAAVGKRLRATQPGAPWREIVGVVGNERDDGLGRPPTPIVYWPVLSESYRWRTMAYAVRSDRVGTASFVRELERAVWSVNASLPLARVQTLEAIQASSMAQTSFALVMLGIAASVALLIGLVGIYGVVAYAASQRTREIGVRMALGAQIGDVRAMFLRHGLALTASGIAIGVGVAVVLTRVMAAFLFGVGPTDPLTYVTVSAVLALTALLATYFPARRAARVDPLTALRADL